MKRLMLDLETLSTQPDAAVTAVGWAIFDTQDVHESGRISLRYDQWVGRIDAATVAWWIDRTREAQKSALCGLDTPAQVIGELTGIAARISGEVWANDPSFDLVILRSWWPKVTSAPFPFAFRAERSVRTVLGYAKLRGIDYSAAWEGAVPHDPQSDAVCQAKAVIIAEQALGLT